MDNFAIIGLGQRGKFYCDCLNKIEGITLKAVCDINRNNINYAVSHYNIDENKCYLNAEDFFKAGKLADLLVIATLDQDHFNHAISALNLGYDLILEKPIAKTEEECLQIAQTAKRLGRKVFVCHVLRYAPIYHKIKEMLASGDFGEVVTMSQTEHVGYWHQAHSYVRGNWHNTLESTPMIIAKCCHDLDLFVWLVNKPCESVSSFGELTYFKKEKAPENSGEYCFECALNNICAYDAIKFYEKSPQWAYFTGRYFGKEDDKEAIRKCFSDKTNPYARCVFKCDNDAVDHQIVNMKFAGGATGQLTMTAFADKGYRCVKLHCTQGEIEASMLTNDIIYTLFGSKTQTIHIDADETFSGHGGGDERMIIDIVKKLNGNSDSLGLTDIDNSIMSHSIGFAAEKSRLSGGRIVEIR